jgi:hypothetical protein
MAEAQVVVSAHVRMVGIQDPITCQFLQRREQREKTKGWRRSQSHANYSPPNSLLTGIITGNTTITTANNISKSQWYRHLAWKKRIRH